MVRSGEPACDARVRELRNRFADWRALLAVGISAALAALGLACGSREAPAHRLLVVGWDGATYRLIDPLLEAGRLPHLASLIARGASARLESTAVPISSAAWAGAVTGKTPGLTGVYSFFEPIPGSYDVRLIDSRRNRATPIWRILARHDLRSVIFGIPVTHPPEPIPGAMVSGMLTPQDGVWAHPQALHETLVESDFLPDIGMWRRARPITSRSRVARLVEIKHDHVKRLLREEDWRLAWIVFKSLDVFSHMQFGPKLAGRVPALLEQLDAVLGELVARVGEDTNVILLSDHGFASYEWRFDPRAWLLEEGLAVLRPDAPDEAHTRDALDTRFLRKHRLRRRSLDMRRTSAMAGVAEGNFGTLWLNLAGREPEGAVPASDAEAVLAQLESRLRSIEGPFGEPLVEAVHRVARLYPGPYAHILPDLVFEVDERVVVRVEMYGPVLEQTERPFPDHDRTGVFVAAGPGIRAQSDRLDLSIFDVTPTALQLLGMPAYETMTGHVAEAIVRTPPIDRIAESSEPADPPGIAAFLSSAPGEPQDDGEVRRRLEELGYVE